ncbi:MAG: hypothetical protein J7M14_01965 [Planctomycetes bacterium]|nr:hypothetical protein [Planctomycetota bacterium]
MTAALLVSASAAPAVGRTCGIEQVARALRLDKDDPLTTAMGAVVDGVSQWQETALYMLLHRVSTLKPLQREDLSALDRPAYLNMLTEPGRYRCRAIRVKVRVFRVLEMTPRTHGDQFGRSGHWPRDKSVWRMYCTMARDSAHGDASGDDDEPLTILSTVEPAISPARVSETTIRGERQYASGPQLEAICVFYKVYEALEQASGRKRKYPMLLAWQFAGAEEPLAGAASHFYIAAIAAIIVMAAVLLMLRRRRPPERKYRPKRNTAATSASGDVDESLKEAAEQYNREIQQRKTTEKNNRERRTHGTDRHD